MEYLQSYSKPLVEIYCDGNQQIGFGHIRRSISLSEQLISDGIDVRISALTEIARSMLPEPKHLERKASVVVFDSFQGIGTLIEKANLNRQITITLDWFGKPVPDINIVVFPHNEVHAKKEVFIGLEYIIIRKEITDLCKLKTSRSSNNVVICLGGGDILNQGHQVAQLLSNQKIDVTLIQGPLTRSYKTNLGYKCLNNPPNYPNLLADCNWVVTNGGGCFFEALCLGKASFVLPQTNFEMNIAQFALEKDALLGIGIENLHQYKESEIIKTALSGKMLVDGLGVERISSIIKNYL